MKSHNICVLGGGGFVGSHLLPLLAARGHRIRVATSRRERCKHLLVLPGVTVVETNIHDTAALRTLCTDMDAIINLVGILHERQPGDFERAHVELPRKLLAACLACGVPQLLHMSALGAQAGSKSRYQQTKAAGESLVLAAAGATVFRPSVIFGPGDHFLTMFAKLLRFTPVVPLAGAHARFQPVFVGDVACAFADALDRPEAIAQRYDLCGPDIYTLAELLRLTATTLGLRRTVLPLGDTASYWFARLMELKPGAKIMTRDNFYAMQCDNVCTGAQPPCGPLKSFAGPPQERLGPLGGRLGGVCRAGGTTTSLASVIGYLKEADPRRAYMAFRSRAGR